MLTHTRSPLFPYTTLFRSVKSVLAAARVVDELVRQDEIARLAAITDATHRGHGEDRVDAPLLQRPDVRPVVHSMWRDRVDRKSTRLNSSHPSISYAVFCLK